jgi:predicted extracellular nuclease
MIHIPRSTHRLLAAVWLLSLLLFSAKLVANARELGPVVRLTTWNLHNLFDEIDDPYNDKVFSQKQVDQKLDRMAEIINLIQPDILGVQEIENRQLLDRLARRVPGMRQTVLVVGNDKARGIQVGLMSKQPISGYRTHRERVLPGGHHFSRDCLEVHIGGALPMTVLVNHFKSKLSRGRGSTDDLRTAQATGVMDIVQELERWRPDLKIAVTGDLNDGPKSPSLRPLRPLFDPFGPMGIDQRFTSIYKSKLIVIDHILLNQNLTHNLVPHGAQVLHRKLVEKVSDHYPVSIELSP